MKIFRDFFNQTKVLNFTKQLYNLKRLFGGLFILGILLDTVARKFADLLPLSANWLGAITIGLGLLYAVVQMVIAKKKKA